MDLIARTFPSADDAELADVSRPTVNVLKRLEGE